MVAMSDHLTSRATRLLRLLRVGLHLARGVAIAGLLCPFMSTARWRAEVKRWSRQLLAILAVKLEVGGEPPPAAARPLMLVANHVSWLDVFAIDAVLPVRFVARSEVRTWPVIGWLSKKVGTFFIRRARRHDTARVNEMLVEAMHNGDPVAVFPEATTTDGSAMLKFHSSLLQPAVIAGATICPVAIRYERADGTPCVEAAYDGDKSVWDTLKLIVTQPEIRARLVFLPPLENRGLHRSELAHAAREAIARSLFPPVRDNRTETAGGLLTAAR